MNTKTLLTFLATLCLFVAVFAQTNASQSGVRIEATPVSSSQTITRTSALPTPNGAVLSSLENKASSIVASPSRAAQTSTTASPSNKPGSAGNSLASDFVRGSFFQSTSAALILASLVLVLV